MIMPASQMQADKAWLDYQAIILDLLRAIHHRKGLKIPDTLEGAKKNIGSMLRLYTMQESLEQIYGLNPNYKRLAEIAQQVSKGNLDSSENELANMLKEAEGYEHIFLTNTRRARFS